MGKTATVVLALIVVGVVGFGIGRASKHCGDHDGGGPPGAIVSTCLTPGPQIIDVALDGAVECGEADLSKDANNAVVWNAPVGSVLQVDFPTPPPFTTMTANGNMVYAHGLPPTITPTAVYKYFVHVYGTGTQTPGPRTPTTTPKPQDYGRIIIMR